ncbi:MAG: FAD-dependent oxidoreductase [Candidatus Cohnella colombiensis]|uniref:FAD-dependent oxidoreductase n=1 Tax=Candidatus Cohnella colombiensis TaxID=3121368 RepID=A0AA95JH02_9BACL|nr:MAG: FAD-dependent oxidoreductase [Cohnella sp.]
MSSQLPQFPQSYWTTSVDVPAFPILTTDLDADVVIVGAGITGITTSYLLSKEGLKVVVLEAGRLLHGTTGHTTAKITAQHDLIYDELIQHFGEDKARLYYDANNEALTFIRNTVDTEGISCDLTNDHAYIYTQSTSSIGKLELEYRAYEKLGIDGLLTNHIELPIDVKSALVMYNQAQFNPVSYLVALIDRSVRAGAQVYEHTTAMKVVEGEKPVVITESGHRISCKYVIAASHFPFLDWKGFYFARLHAERSYLLGVRVKDRYEGGMYISADEPKRSIRVVHQEKEPLLLIGGGGHKAGQNSCTMNEYDALKTFAYSVFDVKEIAYRWSAQDLVTLDKIPYIGQINGQNHNILIATGYRKWGMTNGTAAAHLLKNRILGIEDRYRELFDPSRFHADPEIKSLVTENLDVASHLINGKLESVQRRANSVENDEGAVVSVNGKRAGAYRDVEGVLHLVDTTCTHMGCETNWNNGDRTWDCPCHGSRFSYTGEVIEGPAKEPLHKLELSYEDG